MNRPLALLLFLFLLSWPFPLQASPPAPVPWQPALPTILPAPPAVARVDYTTGQTPGGAYYKIAMPDSWNGDLVIWNHGFSLDPPDADVDLGPLAEIQLGQGYAVAASSYRQNGWALFHTREDLEQLYDAFVEHYSAPQRVFLYGASLGGAVTAQAVEQADLGNVVAALTLCGALAGSRNWDGAFDLRLLYDVVSAGVPGGTIPGGPEGLPADSTLTRADIAQRVNATTGILLPSALRSSRQQANLDLLLSITGLPEAFLLADMNYATLAISDLVHDPAKLGGRLAFGNQEVVYGNPAVDAAVLRVAPDPMAARLLRQYFRPTGAVGDVKIIAIHTDKDGLVIVENESEYAAVVPPANLTTAVAVESTPTHCGFTPPELMAAWNSLRIWAGGAAQPTVSDLQQRCQNLIPVYPGACRFTPDYQIPDMDARIRPRGRWELLFHPQMWANR